MLGSSSSSLLFSDATVIVSMPKKGKYTSVNEKAEMNKKKRRFTKNNRWKIHYRRSVNSISRRQEKINVDECMIIKKAVLLTNSMQQKWVFRYGLGYEWIPWICVVKILSISHKYYELYRHFGWDNTRQDKIAHYRHLRAAKVIAF